MFEFYILVNARKRMIRKTVFIIVNLLVLCVSALVLAQTKGGGFSTGSATAQTVQWYEESHALVIGINSYSNGWPALSSACSDADQVAKALKNQGFKVTVLKNKRATRQEIMRNLSDVIPPKLSSNQRFFLYFSGHGQTRTTTSGKPMGYLVPSDGKKINGLDQYSSYISMKQLKDTFLDIYTAKHVLVVADSCFSGLMTSKSGGLGSAIVANALQYKGSMVLTAGGQNEQAADGIFAPVLVDAINGQADTNHDGAVTFGELSLYVQQNVAQKSRQRPVYGWWAGNGEMVFTQKAQKVFSVSTPVQQTIAPQVVPEPVYTPPPVVQRYPKNITHLARPTASSMLTDTRSTHYPEHSIDGRTDTAWVEGVSGYGEGEYISYSFSKPIELDRVGIFPGYGKNVSDNIGDRFYKNSRVRVALIQWDSGKMYVELKDWRQIQYFNIHGSSKETKRLRIIIKKVHKGSKWADTCIGEVEIWGVELD